MAEIDAHKIKEFCRNLAEEIKVSYPTLDLYFIVYEDGMKSAEITKILPTLKGHPAFEKAVTLMRFKSAALEHSAFLGIAEGFEKSHLGLKRTPKNLAIFTINLGDYETEDDTMFNIYRLICQLFETVNNTDQSATDQLPARRKTTTLPNTIVNARNNLQADVFNVLHQIQRGNKDAARERASERALQALSPTPIIRPDEFPFPIALDVTEYAFKKHAPPQLVTSGNKRYEVIEAYKLAQNVVSSFENESLKIWAQFVGPCQIMAWSGHSPSQILGAATLSSPNPFVKATGHLLAEITKIQPVTDAQLTQGYNPFLDDEINLIRHTRNVDETFEMAMIHCMEADSHLPFLRVANNQNEGLLKGHISGWCAHALQSAAKAYMGARDFGVPAHQAARLEFQMVKKQDGWKALLQISQYIMELARKGTEAKTLSNLAAWCGNQPELRFIVNSLAMTISDPSYSAKMKVAVEMPSVTPLAAATGLKSVARPSSFTPAPAHMPSLGLGGGGGINLDDAKKILLDD